MGKTSNLVPLLVLFVLIMVAAFVGFIVYSVANDVSEKAAKRMEKKNIKFSKGGMKFGVKEVSTEDMSDNTQSTLMKVWNAASWPGYQSKLGWGQSTEDSGPSTPTGSGSAPVSRKPYSRSNFNSTTKKKA